MAIEGRCAARAALAGNPSDGFGGAVLATVVPGLEAIVRALPGPGGPGHDLPLVAATLRALRTHGLTGDDDAALTVETSIPRSVGLAGSSAIVIATARALLGDRAPSPLDLARLALDVEVDGLGIAAGPQDRIVQSEGRTVLMDFGSGDWLVTPIDPPVALELFVAWTQRAEPTPSHEVHEPLQGRASDPGVRKAMARLGGLAHEAGAALRRGDRHALGRAMDQSYEERARVLDLEPAHVALVDGARAQGAAVNYAGSGGAVVGLADDLDRVERWARTEGHGFLRWTLGRPPTIAAWRARG